MNSLRKSALLVVLAVAALLPTLSFAQGPIRKQINYDINAAYGLRMGNYVIPAGKYILYQMSDNDLNLFGLYQENLSQPPIAMIRTVRVDYLPTDYPGKTSIVLTLDESGSTTRPVVHGWNIPGEDGWEIISVVERRRGVLTRLK